MQKKPQARIDFTAKLEDLYRDEIMEKLFKGIYIPGLAFHMINNYPGYERKENNDMKVFYNGFTGELVKLERKVNTRTETLNCINAVYTVCDGKESLYYNLSIYDSEKNVTHSFENVKLSDVKFIGGAVSFE